MAFLGKKGQVSVEYMTIVGVMLVAVAILSGYAFFMYNETIALNHVQNAMKDLKQAVNTVYALGEGNSLTIDITLPSGVTQTRFDGKAIFITTDTFGVSTEDFVETNADVSGSLPISAGTHTILVSNVNGAVTLNEV